MNFILTKYIHPIQEPIKISSKFRFELDNPRTDEEINIILSNLEISLKSPDEVYKIDNCYRIPVCKKKETKGILTIEDSLNNLNKNYSRKDKYVKLFFDNNKKTETLEKLAKMWIIARFDDEGENERLEKIATEMIGKGDLGFCMLDKGNPIIDNCENLVSYSYLLSLLFHSGNEFYYGDSFVLQHSSFELQYPKIDRFINQAILYFGIMSYSNKINHKNDRWLSFLHIKDEIISASEKLDNVTDESNKEKILFIANLLKTVGHDIKDVRYKLVTLVSIIELMLTHNPDYNRFNVEESISKQFILKTSILVYQNDKTKELNWLKERLKEIYNQRSNIAHGNFKNLKNYLSKEVNKSHDEEMSEEIILEKLTSDVYAFIRAIIEEYIKDRKMVDFLKDN